MSWCRPLGYIHTAISKTPKLVLILALLASIFLPIFSQVRVSAASVYDNALHVAPPIEGWNNGHDRFAPNANPSCDSQTRMMNDWYTILDRDGDSNYDTALQDLKNVLQGVTPGGWGIRVNTSANADSPNYYSDISIFMWNGTANVIWQAPQTSYPNGRVLLDDAGITNRRLFTIGYVCDTFSQTPPEIIYNNAMYEGLWTSDLAMSWVHPDGIGSVSGQNGWTANYNRELVFLSGNYNANYPSGYAGREIPAVNESFNKPAPEIVVQVDGWDIEGIYGSMQDDFAEGVNRECILLNWQIMNLDETLVGEEVTYKLTEQNTVNFTAEVAGNYALKLNKTYDIANCGSSDIIIGYKEVIVEFYVDGQSRTVNGLNNCRYEGEFNEVYVCDGREGNTVCEYTGITDIHNFVICQIGNFLNNIKNWFFGLFTVRQSFLQTVIDNLRQHVEENSSFLMYTITWFGGMVNAATNTTASCTIEVSNVMGGAATWNICRIQNDWPELWQLSTSVLRISIVAGLIYGLYSAFMKLWSRDE